MSNILDRKVLLLNRSWVAIGTTTVKSALEDLNSSKQPKKALRIEFAQDESGEYDFSAAIEITPLGWEDWIKLPPRPFDENSIRTVSLNVRVPTVVIVGSNYNRVPLKTFRATKRNLYENYGGRCIWSGEIVPYKIATLEHMHPRSRGGNNSWGNLAIASPHFNRLKADRTPDEFGMTPKYKLKEPKPVTAALLLKAEHPDWALFVKK